LSIPSQLNILFIGEESAGVRALRAIACTHHRVVGVMTSPPQKARGPVNVWTVARSLGYEPRPARLVKSAEFAASVRSLDVDIILNVHSLFIIHAEILRVARMGGFNMHPGPLPQYAGLNCVSWALYRGETNYGVTVHQMSPKIDTGPVVYQSFFPIEDTDSGLSLTSKCVKAGVPLIMELLEAASNGPERIPLVQQDLGKREYFGPGVPEDGQLTWSRPATQVVNFVRACDYSVFPSPWGHPRARLGGRSVAILKASRTGKLADSSPGTVGRVDDSGALVACADQWVLVHLVEINGQAYRPANILD
jgi:methionyl-tRNA formyltransferase